MDKSNLVNVRRTMQMELMIKKKKKNPHTMLDVVIRYSKEVLCLENQSCKSLICARFGAMFNSYFYFSSVFIFFYFPGQQKRQTRASWNSSGREEKWKEFLLCYWLYRSELKKTSWLRPNFFFLEDQSVHCLTFSQCCCFYEFSDKVQITRTKCSINKEIDFE